VLDLSRSQVDGESSTAEVSDLASNPFRALYEAGTLLGHRFIPPYYPPSDEAMVDLVATAELGNETILKHFTRRHRGRQMELLASALRLAVDVRGVKTSLCCFVNGFELYYAGVGLLKLQPNGLDCPLFLFPGPEATATAIEFFSYDSRVEAVNRLGLRGEDFARICNGQIRLSLHPSSGEEVVAVIDALADLIELLPPPPPEKKLRLPEGFEELTKYAKRWAIGDDLERGEKMARAKSSTLKALWDAVLPRFADINAYLDQFDAVLVPEEGCNLGAVAQAAEEARITLIERGEFA
jgi:hypothetical protein